jgi:hypothetical protein
MREDLEELWKLMVQKSALSLFDTMTGGDGAISFIEDVDPGTPSTVPEQTVYRYTSLIAGRWISKGLQGDFRTNS